MNGYLYTSAITASNKARTILDQETRVRHELQDLYEYISAMRSLNYYALMCSKSAAHVVTSNVYNHVVFQEDVMM